MVGDGGDRRSCGEDPDLPREGSLSSLITHLLQSFLRISVKVSGLGWKASYPHKISKAELINSENQSTGYIRSLRFPAPLRFVELVGTASATCLQPLRLLQESHLSQGYGLEWVAR